MNQLDATVLIERAIAATSYDNLGDVTLPARLAELCARLQGADLNEVGKNKAAENIYRLLIDRLNVFRDHETYQLDREKIAAPLIATGEPRSGTTLLHALLAEDPQARSARFWQVMHPSPPPGLAAADDPRIELANAEWREILELIPRWMISHPYNDMLGDGLPECERFWAIDFRTTTPTAWWRVPVAGIGGLPADHQRQYRIHRMVLQALQHGQPARRWALKGTSHHERLAALFETYPDAQVIWIHRDPVQIIASRIQLLGEIFESIAGQLDWPAFAAATLAAARAQIAARMQDSMIDDPRILHLRYHEFTRDPVGSIREVYRYFKLPFTDAYVARMRSWLADNHSDRYGKFAYSTKVIGADIEALHAEFADYRARFGVLRESC